MRGFMGLMAAVVTSAGAVFADEARANARPRKNR